MNKKLIVGALVVATVLGGAGVAMADGVSTPGDLTQGGSAVTALLSDLTAQLTDFTDGPRPEGADGTEVEPVDADPRVVEGPTSGLTDGPLD